MPVQPGGVSKTKRLQTVYEVLTRSGKLDKIELTERVASALATDSKSIARAIYRDLQELVAEGRLSIFYQAPNGGWITADEAANLKNVKHYWAPKGIDQNSFAGELALKKVGGDIVAPKGLSRSGRLRVLPASGKIPNSAGLAFNVAGKGFLLELEAESFPITILVARIRESGDKGEMARDPGLHGQRTILLLLPTVTLSSIKLDGSGGHFAIKFESQNNYSIEDLGSKNGTRLQVSEIAAWDEVSDIIGLRSTTDIRLQRNELNSQFKTLGKSKPIQHDKSAIITAAETIRFVVVMKSTQ